MKRLAEGVQIATIRLITIEGLGVIDQIVSVINVMTVEVGQGHGDGDLGGGGDEKVTQREGLECSVLDFASCLPLATFQPCHYHLCRVTFL
jgi:hypothetical protein